MKKIVVTEPVKKKGLFGTKTVMKKRVIEVDRKTYKEYQKAQREAEEREYEDLLFLDELLDD